MATVSLSNITFDAPDGWNMHMSTFVAPVESGFHTNAVITRHPNTGMSLEDFAEASANDLELQFAPYYQIHRIEKTEVGDKPAQLLEHSFDNTELDANAAVYGSRVQQIQVYVADEDDVIHVLTLSEAAEIFITKRPIFEQIISSFRVQ